jgi:tagatose 6-phosphate kinase
MRHNIVTITLSPTIDRILVVDRVDDRGCVCHVEQEAAGGKGNNAARVIQKLGISPIVITTAGGWNGQHLIDLLNSDGIEPIIMPFGVGVRFHTSVIHPDGTVSLFHEPSMPLSAPDEEVTRWLISELKSRCVEGDLVLLCGSIPPNLSPSIYASIIKACPEFIFGVDTSSAALQFALAEHPYFVKVNQSELEQVVHSEDMLNICRSFVEWGCIITKGSDGSEAVVESTHYRVFPQKVKTINTIGAGDAFMAGFAYGFVTTNSAEEALRWGTACATDSTRWVASGMIDKQRVWSLVKDVTIETKLWNS